MLTTQEKDYLLKSMQTLLDEYDYSYTLTALSDIIDEWASQKETLIDAFKKHPNYTQGKFMIAFTKDYERCIANDITIAFKKYLKWLIMDYTDSTPDEIKQQRDREDCCYLPDGLYEILVREFDLHFLARTISDETAAALNKHLPQIHAHSGQKTSRVMNKICQYLNYAQDKDYNREFAKFADSLSPLIIKRHTVLSINPLDYLTMSFGNSWASCHTIDKKNKRGMPNSYEGMYSSGTISYMLDKTSMVFYTVDAEYNGDDYWTQPKICRQMFHYGEDKLVQSRLYPQDNDCDAQAYEPYRNIVQSIMATIFDFPNLWTLTKGRDAASRYIHSTGTHYTDYTHFNNCTLSRKKDTENEQEFIVGAYPICIQCGETHEVENNINHCASGWVCEECGRRINDPDDVFWIDGYSYCGDCTTYCEDCDEYVLERHATWVESVKSWVCNSCLSEYYTRCEDCEAYYERDDVYYIEDEGYSVCPDCFNDRYYTCDKCGYNYSLSTAHDHNDGNVYCDDCYAEVLKKEAAEAEEEA